MDQSASQGHPREDSTFDQVAAEFEALIEATLHLNSTLDLESMGRLILEGACRVLDSEAASMMLLDERGQQLHWFAALGPAGSILGEQELRPGEGIAGWVAQVGESVLTNAAASDPRFCARIDALSDFATRALVCVPLQARGRIMGVLEFLNPRGGRDYDARDLRKGQAFASLCAAAIENARLFRIAEEVGNVREIARFKADMVTVVAHQMRNPLTCIRGYSEALMLDESLSRPQVELFSRRIHGEAARLDRMIDDYLRLSRMESGQVPVQEGVLDLGALLADAAERFATVSPACPVSVAVPLDGPVGALGDRVRVVEVLDCLLDNAIKFSPDGGNVELAVAPDGGMWRVTVTDRGLGIPSESLVRVFHPFYRVPLPRHMCQLGTGLGLTRARILVEQMGGRLGVESAPGEGSTFWFCLPQATDGA